MEVFNSKLTCPKCGGSDLSHRYRQKGQRLDDAWGSLLAAQYDLIRTYCRTCSHRWSSLPMDVVCTKLEEKTNSNSDSYSYETVQDGYVIYDHLGKKIDPWQLVSILNNALVLSGSL